MVQNQTMSKKEVDDYLESLKQLQKSTLEILRKTILEILPKAEQCISYQIPTFKVDGKAIAGFSAFKNHFSYFPMSGSVLDKLGKEAAKYQTSKGTLQFWFQSAVACMVECHISPRLKSHSDCALLKAIENKGSITRLLSQLWL
jgi:uncharacterized protein YdhG (YjbR/CyaY superfamily)